MGINVVLAYLWEILPHEGAEITAHTINRNRERAIGVFLREGRAAKVGTVGGIENASYEVVRVTLLVRWGRDGGVAEKKSVEIYCAVAERRLEHDSRKGFMVAVNDAPVWLGLDERGIFETVIDFDLYAEKEENDGISGE